MAGLNTVLKKTFVAMITLLTAAIGSMPTLATDRSIILQSTTSTANSGLYEYLLPIFEKKTGIKVKIVAVGTGQAIKNAQNGDGDVLLVHAKADEEQLIAAGYGGPRFDVMYNDFVIVGPPSDPAKIAGMRDAAAALKKVAVAKAVFVSRGDNYGTHKKETQLWSIAGADPKKDSGGWYREIGSGMGTTLNAAHGMGAYTVTDRATWISFKNRGDLKIVVEGDIELFNQYGVMLVSPKRFSHVKAAEGQAFIDWMLSKVGQDAIGSYEIGGQQLFFPNAK